MISLRRRASGPLRIGHRGAAALAPENTLGSFRAAVEAGVDLVEFDVLDLRDGTLVVAHSDDLAEVTHRLNALIEALAPLGDAPLETAEPVPTLPDGPFVS